MSSLLERLKIPHVFVLLIGVILFCSLLTYVIPSGTYDREERVINKTPRTVVVPGSYESTEKQYSLEGILVPDEEAEGVTPVSLVQFLSAIPRGMEDSADIIFFIFIIGGVFGVLRRTGTIIAFLQRLLDIFGESGPLLTIILMFVIAVGGSTLGMGEEFIPLVPLFLIVSKKLGYDRIFGLAMVMLAADIGFASATTNPFTVQIAQGIAEVPLLSGLSLRILLFITCLTVTLIYVLRYGERVRKDRAASLMPDDDFAIEGYDFEKVEITPAHKIILAWGIVVFVGILILGQVYVEWWWLNEMSGGFLLIGIVAVIVSDLSINEGAEAFVEGMNDMVVAALVVGFARGILVVLQDAQVMDTVIFWAASLLEEFPTYVAAEGMLVFQTVLNFFIPSGSGQAAVTMPLMAPLADVLGLTRQTAVLAFTCGDGYSNTIVPTSGVLMAMLSLAGIPYNKWLQFMFPLFVLLMAISGIFLAVAVAIGYH